MNLKIKNFIVRKLRLEDLKKCNAPSSIIKESKELYNIALKKLLEDGIIGEKYLKSVEGNSEYKKIKEKFKNKIQNN